MGKDRTMGVNNNIGHGDDDCQKNTADLCQEFFRRCSTRISSAMGSPWMFLTALFVIVAWAATGPLFHFSDAWQLVINTGTTIVTFLMVFLIQNTQNRDTRAIQLKLDELLRGVKGARTGLVNLEALSDRELDALQAEFERLRNRNGQKVKAAA